MVLAGFGAPTLQLAAWAIGEQRGTRGTPRLDRYLDFLRNSMTLTITTVVICLFVAIIVTNARRFAHPRLVGTANRLTAVGYAAGGGRDQRFAGSHLRRGDGYGGSRSDRASHQ